MTRTILDFLASFPTPTAVLEADPGTLRDVINPVGLQAVRCTALKFMSESFLSLVTSHHPVPSSADPSAFLVPSTCVPIVFCRSINKGK